MSTVATILERERCRVSAASPVLYEKSDRVAFVTLNRPCDGNFVTHEMNEALHRVWTDIAVADDVDITVLTGAGTEFCTGAELDVSGISARQRRSHKPVIAAINGSARGRGLELALECDVRIASLDATLGSLEWPHGFHYNDRTKHLVRRWGLRTVMQLACSRTPVDAGWALADGVVSRISTRDHLMITAEQVARS